MTPPLEIRSGRRPFQVITMTAGVLSSTGGLANTNARSNAIQSAFPTWFVAVYYGSMLIWCGLTLAVLTPPLRRDIAWDKLRVRLQVERAGLYGMGYTCAAYGAAALSTSGLAGLTAASFVGLFGAAAGWRIVEIHNDLRKLSRALRDPQPADPPPLADPEGGG